MIVSLNAFREFFRTDLTGKFADPVQIGIGIGRADGDVKLLGNSGASMLKPVVILKCLPTLT